MMSEAQFSDPAAAQARAAALRTAAERVGEIAQRLDARVEAMDYQGPAAARFRESMRDRSRRARAMSRQLEEAADRLTHGGRAA